MINHDKAIYIYSISGFYYDVKQFISMDATVPVAYGSYNLECNCHNIITRPQYVYIAGRLWYTLQAVTLIFELVVHAVQLSIS